MEYITLGNSELNVSRICMGCMGFGDSKKGMHSWTLDQSETEKIIKRGLDLGVNFFDTAIAYQGGSSEQYVGNCLNKLVDRKSYTLATKFIPRSKDEMESGISGREHIIKSLDQSLKNLNMDYVDIYIYHMWDYNTDIEEIMQGLNDVVKSGKVRYIGISNCYAWQLAKANYYARYNNLTEFISMQGHYNLIAREEEREMLPFCKNENIAYTPYSALASGRLSKHIGEISKRLNEDKFAKGKYDLTEEEDNKIISRVVEIAEKYGVSMTEVALAWLLTKVEAPIVGATKYSHIEGAAKSVNLKLSNEDIKYLEEPYVPHKLVGVMANNK